MSSLNDVLEEAKTRLLQLNAAPVNLTGKVAIAYNTDDLLDILKTVKSYPAVGIVYEGMRSVPEAGPSGKLGLSCELMLSLVLVEQGPEIVGTDQKRVRAIDYLNAMRGQFLNQRSVTGHLWHFMVEAPVLVKSGMVCWAQRWSLPIQMKPAKATQT